MKKSFDGKKIREEILTDLKSRVEKMKKKPGLAVICVGDNPVCSKYVGLKQKFAEQIGIRFQSLNFAGDSSEQEIINKIKELNIDSDIGGIMIQMPVPDKFDRDKLISSISKDKDVDGLRYCSNIDYKLKPPVVLAIIRAMSEALNLPVVSYQLSANDFQNKKVVLVGEGFLVGGPLKCYFKELKIELESINAINNSTIERLNSADLVISAVGKAGIIQPEMIKDGVVLIDAGTTEVSGELRGDIDSSCYEKSAFCTPVPGGIGPVTVAMLFKNLVQ